jgi:peptide/nickel transport system substrate-binding protein
MSARHGLRIGLALVVAAVAAATIVLTALGSSGRVSASAGTELIVTRLASTNTPGFGPGLQDTGNDAMVNSLLFSNLVKVAPNESTITPDLALKWTSSPNAKTFTFYLRHGVKWSDGVPFTAADVVFTITKAAQMGPTAYIGYQPTNWLEVAGASSILGTNKPLSGVKALNDYTVQITLAQPNAFFVRELTDAVYAILPQHILQSVTAKTFQTVPFATKDPVGTGPYTLENFVPNQYYEFKANPDYFGGVPKIQTLFFKTNVSDESAVAQLRTGELDVVLDLSPTDYGTLNNVSGLTAKFVPSPAQEYIQFRMDNPRVANPLVRQAVYYAFDRRGMLQNVFGGHGQVRWTLAGLNQNLPQLNRYPYDPTKAKQLLTQAHFNFSEPFRIIYSPDIDTLWPQIAQALQQSLKAIGVNAVLVPYSAAGWTNAVLSKKVTFEITLQAGNHDGLGPEDAATDFGCNTIGLFWSNCTIEKLYTEASSYTNPAQQTTVFDKIALYLNQQLPYASLWETDNLDAYTNKLGGTFSIYSNDRDSFFQVAGWTMSG